MPITIDLRNMCPANYAPKNRLSIQRNSQVHKFSEPRVVGGYCSDRNRQFQPGLSQLKYLKMPQSNKVFFNLKNGEELTDYADYGPEDDRMEHILKFILTNFSDIGQLNPSKPLNYDIVCYKGFIRQLLASVHKNNEPEEWYFLASKYKGTIYICPGENEEQYQRFNAWGFKFEQYMTSGV